MEESKTWGKGEEEREGGAAPRSGARESERRAWRWTAERWEGCRFGGGKKGGISERGLRMVQPKNRENGEEEGAAGGERERVGP